MHPFKSYRSDNADDYDDVDDADDATDRDRIPMCRPMLRRRHKKRNIFTIGKVGDELLHQEMGNELVEN